MERVSSNKTISRYAPTKGILTKMLIDVPYAHLKNLDNQRLKEEDVELTEDDAMHIQCNSVPKPHYDENTKMLIYPRLMLVHYMFKTKQSYCCRT